VPRGPAPRPGGQAAGSPAAPSTRSPTGSSAQHAESFSLPPEFSVIDPADMPTCWTPAGRSTAWSALQRRAPRAPVCADVYTALREHPDDGGRRWSAPASPGARTSPTSWPDCSAAMSRTSGGHGLVDFDDLLLLWRAALADPGAGPVLRGMFDAVLVDEYQDVNALQADIVRLLQPGRRRPDLRRRRRPGHLRLPRRRPGAPAPAVRHLSRICTSCGWSVTTGPASGAAAGQCGAPAVRRASSST
jgi:hypothetical protein